jgi:uncharacterized membrane protein
MKKLIPIIFLICFSFFNTVHAQTLVGNTQETVRAQVVDINSEGPADVQGTTAEDMTQNIDVQILDGSEKGKIVNIDNDYFMLAQGQTFYLLHTVDGQSGAEYYSVQDPYRLPGLIFLVGLFVVCVFLFGGWQGIRGLVSLAGSLLIILYVLIPSILHGYSPVLMTTLVSALIITIGSYITHGLNKTTSAAVIGMIFTVIFTGFLAYVAVHITQLTGYGSEEATYLNLNSGGKINILGLLLGGIIIGLLGVLYDVAIGQAIAVEELSRIAPHVSRQHIFKRALRIGREHIGALVNTLAIAYVGVSLPLLLLFSQNPTESFGVTVNREVFATEIVRTMIGSIGLVLAVPITTAIAVWLLMKNKPRTDSETLAAEEHALSHAEHSHSHSHSHSH